MCGILFSESDRISQRQFSCALEKMKHRGPDVPMCLYADGNIKMGHNRLRILGINEESNQPFYSNDKRYVIIYNGEIYNYRELAKEHDISLKTGCDTELIIELSIKIGFVEALKKFNGMFSYIIYDTLSKNYFVARDRLGVKPLYWYNGCGEHIFSSEINAIVSLLDKTEIDDVGMRQYRKLRTFFNGRTLYKGVSMFPPAHYMENGVLKQYWSLPEHEQEAPDDEELRELILSSVRYRQISDVPVGSYLSGGLDSTVIAAVSKELHTWTIGFPDQNEFEYAEIAAKSIGTEHHAVIAEKDEFWPTAEALIRHRKEPLSVPNEVMLYLLTRKVKEYNTVILSGEGADELFFGYDRIFRWAYNAGEFDIRKFSELYSYGSNDDIEIVESVIEPFYKYGKTINIVGAFFQTAHLHGLLRRLDNSTMMCSVEARVPFTDHRLVERLAGCPYEWKMQNNEVKSPLKRIFKDIVPDKIISRKKVGFPVPFVSYDEWLDFNLKICS